MTSLQNYSNNWKNLNFSDSKDKNLGTKTVELFQWRNLEGNQKLEKRRREEECKFNKKPKQCERWNFFIGLSDGCNEVNFKCFAEDVFEGIEEYEQLKFDNDFDSEDEEISTCKEVLGFQLEQALLFYDKL